MDHLDQVEAEQRPLAEMRPMVAPEHIHCGHCRGGPEVWLGVGEGPDKEDGEDEYDGRSERALHQEHVCHVHEVEDRGQQEDGDQEAGQDVAETVHPQVHAAGAHQQGPHAEG